MRKLPIITLVVIIILVFSFGVMAKSNKADLKPEENVRAGGGFNVGVINLDISSLNTILKDAGFAILDSNVLMYGGSGIGGEKIGYRLGGLGTGGRMKSVKNDKKAILDIGYGGLIFGKGIYTKNNFDLAWRSLIGAGSLELTLIHNDPGIFEDVVKGVDENNEPYSVSMTKNFFTIEPGINLHYQFNKLVGIDFNAGYLLSFDIGDSWNIKDEPVNDGPLSNIKSPHLALQLTLGF